jgi:hypothetical protein
MIEGHLSGMKARNGTIIFICSTCKVPSIFTFGAKDNGVLVYMMLCRNAKSCWRSGIRWKSGEASSANLPRT